jgi:hypothetical protein
MISIIESQRQYSSLKKNTLFFLAPIQRVFRMHEDFSFSFYTFETHPEAIHR